MEIQGLYNTAKVFTDNIDETTVAMEEEFAEDRLNALRAVTSSLLALIVSLEKEKK